MSMTEMIVGFDLCPDYSQIAYYDAEKKEPENVGGDSGMQIPTVLCRLYDNRTYLAGFEAEKAADSGRGELIKGFTENISGEPFINVDGELVAKSELIYQYLSQTLMLLDGSIAYLTVTADEMNLDMAECIRNAGAKLGLSNQAIAMQSHMLSYEYYALSQRRDLWSHDVGLFEYSKAGLFYHHLSISWKHQPVTVVSETTDLREYLNGSEIRQPSVEMDKNFLRAIQEVSARRTISTFYLVGEGFGDAGAGSSWMKQSLQQLCSLRRHVFVGQNLYARGACYHSYYLSRPDLSPGFSAVNADLLTKEVYIKTVHFNSVGKTILIPAGIPWYSASSECRVITDGCSEIIIRVHDVLSNIEQKTVLHLKDFPTRPSKTVLLKIQTAFESESICHITAKDIGFGELFKSSGKSWESRFDIYGIPDMAVPAENGSITEAFSPKVVMGHQIRMSGVRVYTLEELCWYISENVYTLTADFFDDGLLNWLDCITGSHKLALAIINYKLANKPLKDIVRLLLNSVDYLSAAEISRVYTLLTVAEKQNPIEHAKVAADNYCKYGHYMAALKIYHQVAYQMEHDSEKDVTRQFKAATWHNMGVTFIKLHNMKSALSCLARAYEIEKNVDYLKHYLYALEMADDKEGFMDITEQAHLTMSQITQIKNEVANAARDYRQSEEGRRVTEGIASKNKGMAFYDEFVQEYLAEQKKRYDIN